MVVALVGTIVTSADNVTGWNGGNVSTDDDFVEGLGSVGVKASAITQELYTTSITGGPYNFSTTFAGYHIIAWFNTKTPIDTKALGGLAIIVGNGTSRGKWYVRPTGFYKGGFITRVANTAAAFNNIAAGTWTLGGNPGQLTAVTQVGVGFVTITSIMGNFNNVQVDQITAGLGLRVTGTETFETVRAADEDTAFYGWWSSAAGAFIGKGKLYIGPATGSTATTFTDTAFSVIFANEDVAATFYEIQTIGTGTNVNWTLGSISAAAPAVARWALTVTSTTASFNDTSSVLKGSGAISLSASTTMTGTTFIDGTSLTQNGATLTSISVLTANVTAGNSYITSTNPALITNSTFTYNAGHAIVITTPGTYSFTGNIFESYLGTPGTNLVVSSGSTGAAIYNNSGGSVVLNIAGGGDTPTIRNGAGATTTVNNNVTVTVTVQDSATTPIQNAQVAIYKVTGDVVVTNALSNVSGIVTVSTDGSTPVYIRVRKSTTGSTRYVPVETVGNTGSGLSLTVTLLEDEIVDP
jgi:hypothetical protein